MHETVSFLFYLIINYYFTYGEFFTLKFAAGPSLESVALWVGPVEYTDCIAAEEQHSSNENPGYDTKQSDVEAPVILKLWGMRSTPLLPPLLGPLSPDVVTPHRVLSMAQIKLNCELMLN